MIYILNAKVLHVMRYMYMQDAECIGYQVVHCSKSDISIISRTFASAFREIQVMQVHLDFKDHKVLLESLDFHRDQRYLSWFWC